MAFEPHYPQRHGRPGLQMTCEKRGHLFIRQHSFIKKKKKKHGENLICVSWLSSGFWLRQQGPFLSGFSIRLLLGHLLTHSLTQ